MLNWKILTVIMVAALLLASCGGQEAAPPAAPAPTPAVIDAGKLYATNCLACHGADRQGISGLGKPLTPESLAPLTDAGVRDTILNGKPETLMTAWQGRLSLEEIDALVQFIKYVSP
ncbi:MAG: cytochrome c [Chloroflexi bacterium]|nr:cytochrome c [Chloroflexota bacterium]